MNVGDAVIITADDMRVCVGKRGRVVDVWDNGPDPLLTIRFDEPLHGKAMYADGDVWHVDVHASDVRCADA